MGYGQKVPVSHYVRINGCQSSLQVSRQPPIRDLYNSFYKARKPKIKILSPHKQKRTSSIICMEAFTTDMGGGIMRFLSVFTSLLLIIGGLNWLFVALDFNLVTTIFASGPSIVTLIYWLIGLSAIYQLYDGYLRGR